MKYNEIRFTTHVRERCIGRGVSEQEIIETIDESLWQPAKSNKLECRKKFVFNALWSGKFYAVKEVKPIFVNENGIIVVISVYTYYY